MLPCCYTKIDIAKTHKLNLRSTKYKFVTWFSDLFDASLNCVFKVGR